VRSWNNIQSTAARPYQCPYCGKEIASEKAFSSGHGDWIHVCPLCTNPTYFTYEGDQFPDVSPGEDVAHVPPDVDALYREARDAIGAGAYTGAVLLARKLLMNIGVAQGAKEGESFVAYVEYLADKGFVPPNGRGWVDHIRTKGNEANHEIVVMARTDAEELISFIEMLLKFIYEFPSRVPQTGTSSVP
jgi:uncharacterized protein DUF4145